MSETINVNIGGQEVAVQIDGGNLAAGASVMLGDLNGAAAAAQAAAADAIAAADAVSGIVATKLNIDGGNSEPDFSSNALYTPPTPATYTRPIGEKFNEARSALDFVTYAIGQEIKDGTYTGEINTQFQSMLDSGENLLLPEGTYPIDTDGFTPVLSTNGQRLIGQGVNAKLVNQVVSGTPVRPSFIITGNDVELAGFEVQANTASGTDPTMAGGQIAFGVAVLVMGDRAHVHHMIVRDSWDGGIAIGRYDLTTGAQTVGAPNNGLIEWCTTVNTGRGTQTHPGTGGIPTMAGSGVNNLLGQGIRVMNCTDFGSTQGFISDYGGGASTFFGHCRSIGPRRSTVPGSDSGGQGWYVGSPVQMVNCIVEDSEGDSYWFDGYSAYCTARGLKSKGSQRRGLLMEGRDNDIEIQVDLASYGVNDAYDAITVRGTSALDGGFTDSVGQILRAQTTGSFHRYGVDVVATGLSVSGCLFGGSLNGRANAIRNGRPTSFKEVGWVPRGSDQIRDQGRRFHRNVTKSWQVEAFGDSTLNGHLFLADGNDPTKRFALGWDSENGCAVLQSMWAGNSSQPMLLNPSGGNVALGGSTGEVWVNFPGLGIRKLAYGADGSGGAPGLRAVIVTSA